MVLGWVDVEENCVEWSRRRLPHVTRLWTAVILYSSALSAKKEDICYSSLATKFLLAVFNNIVIGSVPIEQLASPIKASTSSMHWNTTHGWTLATSSKVLMDAFHTMGLGLERNSCKTCTMGCKPCGSLAGSEQMVGAILDTTASCLCCKARSKNLYPALL